MAVTRDRPYANSNFLVDFGGDDSRSMSMGFAEVIFPQFTVGDTALTQDEAITITPLATTETAARNHIILKRGVIGSLNLYDWWDKARQGKAAKRRTMKIELLSDDQSTVVLTWRFTNVRPVTLCYSPLRAIESGIVMETVILAFDTMNMS